MRAWGHITPVGAIRGKQRAVHGVANGARPDRPVLTSGFLCDCSGDSDNAINTMGLPERMPPTLIVLHCHDGCRVTRPEGVGPFVDWAQGKARVTWLEGGEVEDSHPCEAFGLHGFKGIDGCVVSAVAGFAARSMWARRFL